MRDDDGDGVEVGLTWKKSSFSDQTPDVCVEVAGLPAGGRAVRDSKNPTGPALRLGGSEWVAFTSAIRVGQFD